MGPSYPLPVGPGVQAVLPSPASWPELLPDPDPMGLVAPVVPKTSPGQKWHFLLAGLQLFLLSVFSSASSGDGREGNQTPRDPRLPSRHSPLFPCLFDPLPVLVPPSRPPGQNDREHEGVLGADQGGRGGDGDGGEDRSLLTTPRPGVWPALVRPQCGDRRGRSGASLGWRGWRPWGESPLSAHLPYPALSSARDQR